VYSVVGSCVFTRCSCCSFCILQPCRVVTSWCVDDKNELTWGAVELWEHLASACTHATL